MLACYVIEIRACLGMRCIQHIDQSLQGFLISLACATIENALNNFAHGRRGQQCVGQEHAPMLISEVSAFHPNLPSASDPKRALENLCASLLPKVGMRSGARYD